MNFPVSLSDIVKELILTAIVAVIVFLLGVFRRKIFSFLRALTLTDSQKSTLKLIDNQEVAYLNDLRDRILEEAKNWDTERYVDLEYSSNDQSSPEFREISWRIWKLPTKTNTLDDYLVHPDLNQLKRPKATELIRKHRRLVIKGEPGSGKTITLRKLTMQAIFQARKASNPLPILVDLNRYRQSNSEGAPIEVVDFLKIYLQEAHPEAKFLHENLEETLQRRSVIFFFDGLNEMPPQDYSDRVRKLEEFSRNRRRHKFVFSCRTLHYDPLLEAKAVAIISLDDGRIKQFLHNYLGNSTKVDTLYSELLASPAQVLEACRTPIVLFMIAKLFEVGDELPEDQISIFKGFVTYLYKTHGFSEALALELSESLQKLAFEMVKDRMLSTPVNNEWVLSHISSTDLELINKFGRSSGIVDISANHEVKFSHHMLQEYFAGSRLATLFSKGENIDHLVNDFWWEEVMIVASSLVAKVDEFINKIVEGVPDTSFGSVAVECFSSKESQDNIDVIKYLASQSRNNQDYRAHLSQSLYELYNRIFEIGNSQISKNENDDRRISLAVRTIGFVKSKLAKTTYHFVLQLIETRLLLGNTYQRARVLETCQYIESENAIDLIQRVIKNDDSFRELYRFSPSENSNLAVEFQSFLFSLNASHKLPLIRLRKWLKELAFANLASLKSENAKISLAQFLFSDISNLEFFSIVYPFLTPADLFQMTFGSIKKQLQVLSLWTVGSIIGVYIISAIGIDEILRFVVRDFNYIIWICGIGYVLYLVYLARKSIARRKSSHSIRVQLPSMPAKGPVLDWRSIERNAKRIFTSVAIVAAGILGIIAALFLGIIPVIITAYIVVVLIAFYPTGKTYLKFISDKNTRDEIFVRYLARKNKLGFVFSSSIFFLLLIFDLWAIWKQLNLGFPDWLWGSLLPKIVRVDNVNSTMILLWLVFILTMLYFPAIVMGNYLIIGSYIQLLDIYRLSGLLAKSQKPEVYKKIDQRLKNIVIDSKRWAIARARAIRGLSQSPFAVDHLPLFEILAKDNTETPLYVQESAERAIYEIKRRQEKIGLR